MLRSGESLLLQSLPIPASKPGKYIRINPQTSGMFFLFYVCLWMNPGSVCSDAILCRSVCFRSVGLDHSLAGHEHSCAEDRHSLGFLEDVGNLRWSIVAQFF